jgi:hypothetical protein
VNVDSGGMQEEVIGAHFEALSLLFPHRIWIKPKSWQPVSCDIDFIFIPNNLLFTKVVSSMFFLIYLTVQMCWGSVPSRVLGFLSRPWFQTLSPHLV